MGGGLLETNNQLERFTKNKRNKKIIYSILGILLVIGSITLYKTFAFYEEKKSFNLLKGRIPDFGYDIKMLSVVVDGEKKEAIPERGLYKTQIDCTNSTTGKWDYNAWNLILENVSEQAKCNITFTTNGITEAEQKALIEEGKTKRRNTYRGKDITEYYTDGSLYEMISSGRFDDIYIGDYIVANDVTWLIADLDNYLYTGDTPLTKHHATIIPALPLINEKMNTTETIENGYAGSRMATETLSSLVGEEGIIKKVFGSHLLEYRTILSNSIKYESTNQSGGNWNGSADEFGWYLRKVDLMSEINVYGTTIWSSSGYDTGIDNRQYAIFQLKPEFIYSYGTSRFHYWLKDVIGKPGFALVHDHGTSVSWGASSTFGVRPRFLIG